MKGKKFNDSMLQLLQTKLQKYTTLNRTTCLQIYNDIFESMVDVFQASGAQLTNEAVNYLAQQYYDGVLVNNTQELDPNIFEQRAKLENIATKELALLAVMLGGTDFAVPVLQEIKRRS